MIKNKADTNLVEEFKSNVEKKVSENLRHKLSKIEHYKTKLFLRSKISTLH